MKKGFNVRFTPYTSQPRLELCWEDKPVAQYDATGLGGARGIARMLNDHIRSGETLARGGWVEVGIASIPREFRIMYRNLWRN